jgi:hypothetical protein
MHRRVTVWTGVKASWFAFHASSERRTTGHALLPSHAPCPVPCFLKGDTHWI